MEIKDEVSYQEALKELERLWECKTGTTEGGRFTELANSVDAYERKHHAILPPEDGKPMKEIHLKHREVLLQQIVDMMRETPHVRIADFIVVFHVDGVSFDFTLTEALDNIANDLYWDERGNWAEAKIATRVED